MLDRVQLTHDRMGYSDVEELVQFFIWHYVREDPDVDAYPRLESTKHFRRELTELMFAHYGHIDFLEQKDVIEWFTYEMPFIYCKRFSLRCPNACPSVVQSSCTIC